MARLENHIDRILGEAGECLTAVEITLRLNAEFGDREPYTPRGSKRAPIRCRIFAGKERNIAAHEDALPKRMAKSKTVTP
jgi:hypothetical protein